MIIKAIIIHLIGVRMFYLYGNIYCLCVINSRGELQHQQQFTSNLFLFGYFVYTTIVPGLSMCAWIVLYKKYWTIKKIVLKFLISLSLCLLGWLLHYCVISPSFGCLVQNICYYYYQLLYFEVTYKPKWDEYDIVIISILYFWFVCTCHYNKNIQNFESLPRVCWVKNEMNRALGHLCAHIG